MGVAGFLLGLGLLVFSEMKLVYSWVFSVCAFWFANLAVFRPKKRRESFLAARGMRNLDSEERIEDSGTKAVLRTIACKVHVDALLASLVLTGIALVVLKGIL
jgi:hypothetical protein